MIKYLFSMLIAIALYRTTGFWQFTIAGILELGIIFLLTEIVYLRHRKAALMLNAILLLLFNIQMLLLLFGGSYLQLVMLTNIRFLEDLSGKTTEYGLAAILALIFALYPAKALLRSTKRAYLLLAGALAAEGILLSLCGLTVSPILSYVELGRRAYQYAELLSAESSGKASAALFYKEGVADYRKKDAKLGARPNIILIFAEGLSQNIVDDERNVMPALSEFQEQSLNFTGYYNHTFATLRGLIGQLYSGYQLNDLDENELISLQSVLKGEGYHTVMINTEPANEDFAKYLATFDFDMVIGDTADIRSGYGDSYSDREAFQLLHRTVQDLSGGQSPFFIAMYTFGTHVSFDSVDETFGDGSLRVLNRFYDWDTQFGTFVQNFEQSQWSDHTLLVVTTDHASYADSDFTLAFPDAKRRHQMVDQIPLSLYYKGIAAETCEVSGRNSLDLAPTILDYLDISAPNYFLGSSLFRKVNEDAFSLDTVFNEESMILTTRDETISSLSKEDQETIDHTFSDNCEITVSGSPVQITITYHPLQEETYENYCFAVWSEENEQDDIVWYQAECDESGAYSATFPADNHLSEGLLNVHVYGGAEKAEVNLARLSFSVEP